MTVVIAVQYEDRVDVDDYDTESLIDELSEITRFRENEITAEWSQRPRSDLLQIAFEDELMHMEDLENATAAVRVWGPTGFFGTSIDDLIIRFE